MSGEVDYLLRVVVPDMKAYDSFYQRLITRASFADISSSFAMEEIKYTTALPIDYIWTNNYPSNDAVKRHSKR